MDRLAVLAAMSEEAGALTRRFLTPAHRQAVALVQGWMEQAGMTAEIDAIGNLVGRLAGPEAGPVLMLGSHIDTVRDAGWYDGNFGVLAAIEAVDELRRGGVRLGYGVEVIAFGDEEGVRFAATLSGSRAVSGQFAAAALAAVDAEGISMAAALRAFGCDPAGIPGLARRRGEVAAYVELHIEQGPVLEAEGLAVGVVTAINGASRLAVTVQGQAGHAGTVPMAMRQDALAAAAAMVLAVEAVAHLAPGLVATVGRLEVVPGVANSVPGICSFSIDVRSPQDEVRRQAVAEIGARLAAVATARSVRLTLETVHEAAAVPCAPGLQAQLAAAVQAAGVTAFHLPSGAGHDAMAMAALCDVGMLFVRCQGGISHTPEESITTADAGVAVDVLMRFMRGFEGA